SPPGARPTSGHPPRPGTPPRPVAPPWPSSHPPPSFSFRMPKYPPPRNPVNHRVCAASLAFGQRSGRHILGEQGGGLGDLLAVDPEAAEVREGHLCERALPAQRLPHGLRLDRHERRGQDRKPSHSAH